MSAPSAAKAVKAALVAACRTLWPEPVQVFYGPVGTYGADDYVEVLDVSFTDRDEARMGTARARWWDFTIDGALSCYRGGGDEVQQIVTEVALDMLAELADYLQDSGTSPSTQTSLGGTVQWARLTEFATSDEDEDIEDGRKTYATFTVSGRVLT